MQQPPNVGGEKQTLRMPMATTWRHPTIAVPHQAPPTVQPPVPPTVPQPAPRQWHGLGEPAGVTGWGGHRSGCGSQRWTPVTRGHLSLSNHSPPCRNDRRHNHNGSRRKEGTQAGVQGTSAIFSFYFNFLTMTPPCIPPFLHPRCMLSTEPHPSWCFSVLGALLHLPMAHPSRKHALVCLAPFDVTGRGISPFSSCFLFMPTRRGGEFPSLSRFLFIPT